MTANRFLGAGVLLAGLLAGCAERAWMLVPAKVGLWDYPRIGLVQFAADDEAFGRSATAAFQECVLDARPEVVLVELGPAAADSASLHALADAHDLDADLTGSLDFTELDPAFGIGSSLIEVNVRSDVQGDLTVRLTGIADGATLWTCSAARTETVASARADTEGRGDVRYVDVEGVKRGMLRSMVDEVASPLRDRYFRKKLEDIPPHYEVTYPDGVEVYAPPREVAGGWR